MDEKPGELRSWTWFRTTDLLWLMLWVATLLGWYADHQRLQRESDEVLKRYVYEKAAEGHKFLAEEARIREGAAPD
jgi:hypothetical protein